MPDDSTNNSWSWLEEWAGEAVWQGLKHLAESDLTDFTLLDRTAGLLPFNMRHPWRFLLDEVQETLKASESNADDPVRQRVFLQVLKTLNDRWFVDLGLFLARQPKADPMSLWDLVRVAVHRIHSKRESIFSDTTVPVYLLGAAYPDKFFPGHSCAYDPIQQCVRISLPALQQQTAMLRRGCAKNLEPWESWYLQELPEAMFQEPFPEYARGVAQSYDTTQQLFDALLERSLAEELRHASDGARLQKRIGPDVSGEEYYRQLGDHILSVSGRLREWRQDAHFPADPADLGRIVSEISGQMTAAAIGSNPYMLLADWRAPIRMEVLKLSVEHLSEHHIEAGRCAIRLLGEELGLIPAPRGLRSWLGWDRRKLIFGMPPAELLHLAKEMMALPAERLRLALKSIYAREFVLGIVDEPPFARIESDGTLSQRTPVQSI